MPTNINLIMKEIYITPSIKKTVIVENVNILSSSNNSSSNKHCAFCHEDGHFAYDCPYKKKNKIIENTNTWSFDWDN